MKLLFVQKLANTSYVRSAIEEKADLEAFRAKPSWRTLLGIFTIAFSYLIGWPAISALGVVSVILKEPRILVIGGPLTYAFSHVVFLLGMYLAGIEYSKIFLRWATRMAMEPLIKRFT